MSQTLLELKALIACEIRGCIWTHILFLYTILIEWTFLKFSVWKRMFCPSVDTASSINYLKVETRKVKN